MRRAARASMVLSVLAATLIVVVPRFASDGDEGADETPAALPERAVDVERTEDGAVRSLATEPGAPIRLTSDEPEAAAEEFVDHYGHLLGPGELVATSTTPRLDGGVALRFQQKVDGIPVFGGEASVQVAPDGGVLSSLADLSETVPGTPTDVRVAAAEARQAALRSVAEAQGVAAEDLTAGEAQQWWYDPTTIGAPAPLGPRLTWRVQVDGAGGAIRRLVLIDTVTGTVDLDLDLVGHVVNRKVCDAHGIPQAAPATCTAPARGEGGPATGDVEIDRAYEVLGQWHDFLAPMAQAATPAIPLPDQTATVRYCKTDEPCPYQNAFWSGNQAVFGPGYAVDDVVAHEMTHGLTAQTARLFFAYQSGAINESMSDVFAELIDQANGTDDTAANRWLIGEDLANGPLRDMADPEGERYADPASMTSTHYRPGPDDAGGVHTNSGVGNLAAALLVDGGSRNGHDVRAIGARDTAALWFAVLTGVLTSGSDYADLAVALRTTCRGLVGVDGITARDCDQVDEAVAAVEMDAVPPAAPATDAPVCAAGESANDLFRDSFETGPYDRWVNDTPAGYPWPYLSDPHGNPRYASDGEVNLWGPNTGQPHNASGNKPYGDASLAIASPVHVPDGVPTFLRFSHAYAFHTVGATTRDGGVVEIKVGSNGWQALETFTDNDYVGTISGTPGPTNPLGGRAAFVGDSPGYLSSRADLADFAGQDVKVRFRVTEDATGGDLGWYVDDVRIYSCPATGPQLSIIQDAGPDRVVAGVPFDLTVTVTNTGTDPLTGIAVETPEVPECSGPVPDLAPGAHHDVVCQHPTEVQDGGDDVTLTSTASATASELAQPVTAEPVDVLVLDPGTAALDVTQATEQDTVIAGDDVDLEVTVHNVGALPLTNVTVDSSVDGCDGTVAALLVGEAETFPCTYATVDSADIGTWTPVATATADELTDPVTAAPVGVEVLAPDRDLPGATVTSPEQGAVYEQGEQVLAHYSCDDDSGWVDCRGTVPDGTPIDTSTPGTQTFSISATDLAGNVVEPAALRTYTVVNRRPDGRIRIGAKGKTVGNDRYNRKGVGQSRTVRVARGRSATFFITVQNDGSHPEQLRVRGQPGKTNYRIRYRSRGQDVTAAIRKGTFRTLELAPGNAQTIRVVVTVRAGAPKGSRIDRLVTVFSDNNRDRQDVVRYIVRRR